jgi:hypothetical protein
MVHALMDMCKVLWMQRRDSICQGFFPLVSAWTSEAEEESIYQVEKQLGQRHKDVA